MIAATAIINDLRGYVPNHLIIFMTRTTMAFEAAIPVLRWVVHRLHICCFTS